MEAATEILIAVKNYADQAHGDQRRKYTGERYIGHPVRVMELVREFNADVTVLAAALLHDVLEDTPVSREELMTFLQSVMHADQAERTTSLVEELTDVYIKKNYPRLNRVQRKALEFKRLGAVSADAQTIKYADIIDNVTDIAAQDTDFAGVYIGEALEMVRAMQAGDARLRARALRAVEQSSARIAR